MVLVLALLSASMAGGSPDPAATSQRTAMSATLPHKRAPHAASQPSARKSRPSSAHAPRQASGHAVRRAPGYASGYAPGHAPLQASGHAAAAHPHSSGRQAHPSSPRRLSRSPQAAKSCPAAKSPPVPQSQPAAQPAPAAEASGPDRSSPDFSSPDQAASVRKARVTMPAPLRGSYESLERQNEKTEADGLERIEDENDLADRIARKMLVPLPASPALAVNGNLTPNHRYCRPWTAVFLADLARAHAAQFHRPLEVSSAVRTVDYQKRLLETNGNAAPAEGDVASPHLTGATIDIAKQGLGLRELAWMRAWLLPPQKTGKIDVEEEFQQSCFHITVYKSYVPPRPPRQSPGKTGAGPRADGAGKPAVTAGPASRGR